MKTDPGRLSVPWGPRFVAGLALGLALILAGLAVASRRWRVIIGPGAPPAGFLWRLYLIGSFFSLFLPTAVGGDAVRAAAAARASGTGTAVASVFLDRMFGVLPLFVYFFIGAVVAPGIVASAAQGFSWKIPPLVVAGAVVGGALAAWIVWRLLSTRRWIPKALRDGSGVLEQIVRDPRIAVRALALGMVVQGFYILAWAAIGSALELPLDWSGYLACVPIVTLATMMPVTISGLGLREGAWVLLLGPLGVPSARAIVFGLSFFLCTICVGIVGGILFVTRGTAWTAPPEAA